MTIKLLDDEFRNTNSGRQGDLVAIQPKSKLSWVLMLFLLCLRKSIKSKDLLNLTEQECKETEGRLKIIKTKYNIKTLSQILFLPVLSNN